MLDYYKIHENPPEVQDSVSGDFFPASFSDLMAQKEEEKAYKQSQKQRASVSAYESELINMYASLLK